MKWPIALRQPRELQYSLRYPIGTNEPTNVLRVKVNSNGKERQELMTA
jgi:hypothetical protein